MASPDADSSTLTPPPPPVAVTPVIHITIPVSTKLDRTNFLTWRSQIEPIVDGYGLTQHLDSTAAVPAQQIADVPNPAYTSWRMQDRLLLGWLRSTITGGVLSQHVSCQTAASLWSALHRIYSAISAARVMELRRRLQTTTRGGQSCSEFFETMRSIADQLTAVGEPVSDSDLVRYILNGCLVQVVERSPDGAIESIRLHDLLREVALREATENDFLLIWKKENAKGDVSMTRRVAFIENIDESSNRNQSNDLKRIKMPRLRTFVDFKQGSVIGTGFLLLRVLDLRNAEIRDLPTDLKSTIHLRYLSLGGTNVTAIPSWIGHLQNLHIFDIRDTDIRELPGTFWKIPNLRYVCSSVSSLIVGPPSIANLVNLRSLGYFYVPKSWKKSYPHLHGVRELKLRCDDENDGMVIHNLMSKLNNLLSVTFYDFYPPRGIIDFSTSPSYENIHTMYLNGYRFKDRPSVHIAEMPPNLVKLKLAFFHLNDDPMPKLEKLCSLKWLEIESISMEVDTIVCTCGGFPGLQTLELHRVKEMKEWKLEDGALPMLKCLYITYCDHLRALPDLQCVTTLQELTIKGVLQSKIENKSGEEWDKVKHIPTITGPYGW